MYLHLRTVAQILISPVVRFGGLAAPGFNSRRLTKQKQVINMIAEKKVVPMRQPEKPEKSGAIFPDVARQCQMDAIAADVEQQAALLDNMAKAYRSLRLEKAKFLVAFLNPIFFQKALESLEGAKIAVTNYWAMGDGLFFYRYQLACKIGKYGQGIILKDELTQPQLLQIAIRLQSSVRWAEKEMQGARVK